MADHYTYYNSQPALSTDTHLNYILLNQHRIVENHGLAVANNESMAMLTTFYEESVLLAVQQADKIKSLEDEARLLMIFLIIVGIGVAAAIMSIIGLYCMGPPKVDAAEGSERKPFLPLLPKASAKSFYV
jgi:hypothetical protein